MSEEKSEPEIKPIPLNELIDQYSPTEPFRWVIGHGVWEFRHAGSFMASRRLEKEAKNWAEMVMQTGADGRYGAMLPEAQRAAIPEDITTEGAIFAFKVHRLVTSHEGPIGLPDALRVLTVARLCATIETGLDFAGSRDLTTALSVDVRAEKKSSADEMPSQDTGEVASQV